MRVTSILVLFVTLCVNCQQRIPTEEITLDDAKALLDSWSMAYYEQDTALLSTVLHPKYTYAGADGAISTKGQVLSHLESDDSRILKQDLFDLRLIAHRETAIVRGWERLFILTPEGDTVSLELRFIDTYLRDGGRLQAFSTQSFTKED